MTPREKRLAVRLIAGPVTREEADRAAKVSNAQPWSHSFEVSTG